MLSDAVFRFDRAQVKHGDVVQVSLIIVAINSSAHLGRYTLTASNAAGSASASIVVRLVAAASSPSTASYAYQTPGDRHPAAVLQHPATQQSGIFAKLLVPRTHNKLGDRSFSAAGPRLRNDLSPGLRRPGLTFDSFTQSLKTRLFGDEALSDGWMDGVEFNAPLDTV